MRASRAVPDRMRRPRWAQRRAGRGPSSLASQDLLRLARRAVAEPDLEAFADEAADVACRLAEGALVTVWERQPGRTTLMRRGTAGPWRDRVPHELDPCPDRAPLAAHVLATGRTLLSERLAEGTRPGLSAGLLAVGARAAAVVPIAGRDGPAGVVSVFAPRPTHWRRPLVEQLEAVAGLLGAAFCHRLPAAASAPGCAGREGVVGIVHDFNNLVTAISGYAGLALSALPGDVERAACDVRAIVEAADHASALSRRLLALDRGQAPEAELVDVAALVERMHGLLRRLAGDRVDVVCRASAAPCRVVADPVSLERILLNLVGNARDAMPLGGRIELACAPSACGDAVRLTVSDTGTGMDAPTCARAFDPLFTTKPADRGTGLGLAVVRQLVASLGGSIQVESVPGAGTTFAVDLPAAAPRTAAVPSGIEITLA